MNKHMILSNFYYFCENVNKIDSFRNFTNKFMGVTASLCALIISFTSFNWCTLNLSFNIQLQTKKRDGKRNKKGTTLFKQNRGL